ncbi:hypothetical protein [Kribbella sp. NPDC049584]|uniref:hypothetical protein n=1 Tax=Kribbella sp. NPDC049584 TaxID=3154833 RepID=UPI003443BD06
MTAAPPSTPEPSGSPLLESAYDFVEHSLEEAQFASDAEPRRWKFAIIDIATAVELFLKERLRREHPILIYTKVDDGTGHTVSLETALKRLQVCKVSFAADDVVRLRRARDIRNSIVHFSSQATSQQLRAAYIDLFEFAHVLHERELGEELHNKLDESYWATEALLISEFRREYLAYQGEIAHRDWPSELVNAQYFTHVVIDGTPYLRIPYGDEREGWAAPPSEPCHDCYALAGQLHGPDCDTERCPKCGGQALMEECAAEYGWGSWPDETAVGPANGTPSTP